MSHPQIPPPEYGSTISSGLKWTNVGCILPTGGLEMTNPQLATALESQSHFNQAQWDTFRINTLGLKWEGVERPPTTGTEIKNMALASALLKIGKPEFIADTNIDTGTGTGTRTGTDTGTDTGTNRQTELTYFIAEFSNEEWDKFKVPDLSYSSYIKVGTRCFKPVANYLRTDTFIKSGDCYFKPVVPMWELTNDILNEHQSTIQKHLKYRDNKVDHALKTIEAGELQLDLRSMPSPPPHTCGS